MGSQRDDIPQGLDLFGSSFQVFLFDHESWPAGLHHSSCVDFWARTVSTSLQIIGVIVIYTRLKSFDVFNIYRSLKYCLHTQFLVTIGKYRKHGTPVMSIQKLVSPYISLTSTICLPILPPFIMFTKALGALSSPFSTVWRATSFPLLSHSVSWSRDSLNFSW